MKKLIKILIAFAFVLPSFYGYAQTAAEIEMAKSMAKTYGYSESEINAMLSDNKGGTQATQSTTVGNVDRNVEAPQLSVMAAESVSDSTIRIYGHSLFSSSNLNIIPNYNIPTPANYQLAPGDELILDIWGATYMNYTKTISPEGSITIEYIGPVYLTGYTIEQAEKILRERLSTIYSGMSGDNPNTFLRLTLGKIRTLSVNVLGESKRSGTYNLPSLSTVFSAVYLAGGPDTLGSVRDMRIYRNGKLKASFDTYDFLLTGNLKDNIRLEDNDLIVIPPYHSIVRISGGIKRPMYYEMKEGETIADLIEFAAGYKEDAEDSFVHVKRIKDGKYEAFDVEKDEYASFKLMDGDEISVPSNIRRSVNGVAISGAVMYPGDYAITSEMSTLKSLIDKAGGLLAEAYMDRGYVYRFNERRDSIALSFNVAKVVSGEQDIPLVAEDSVIVFANYQLYTGYSIQTQGELNIPSQIQFREGMSLGDAIILSGGLKLGASKSNIDVARRNIYDKGENKSDTVAIVYTFNIEKDPSALDFKLAPYDIVSVRSNPSYRTQQSIRITGEVHFPGYYVVEKSVVRISEILNKAGGYTDDAYLEGATVERMLTDEEYDRAVIAAQLARQQVGVDSTLIEMPDRNERYKVGINLKKALENPGSYHDLILSDNDIINIPKYVSTVKISGAVLVPTVVTYVPSYSIKDYIRSAGGYDVGAIKSKKYIVYMNGSASTRGSKNFKPQPGCEIIIPKKDLSNKRPLSAAEIVSLASSTTSIATMVVSMVNLLK